MNLPLSNPFIWTFLSAGCDAAFRLGSDFTPSIRSSHPPGLQVFAYLQHASLHERIPPLSSAAKILG
jgi:hypothetical protein